MQTLHMSRQTRNQTKDLLAVTVPVIHPDIVVMATVTSVHALKEEWAKTNELGNEWTQSC